MTFVVNDMCGFARVFLGILGKGGGGGYIGRVSGFN